MKKGTSVILKNNYKGGFLIDILKNNSKIFEQVPIKYAIDGNLCLVDSVKPHKDRKLFFKLLNQKKLNKIVEICLEDKVDFLIVNFWDTYFNYGALLTAYSMQELVQSYGFTTKHLDVGQRTNKECFKNSFMEDFTKNYLNVTNKLNYNKANELSKNVKGVILGSDQILRCKYINYNLHKYLLNWVDINTKKIAISASFGVNKDEFLSFGNFSQDIKETMLNALNSFDYLSCRESSGKDIYRDVFGLNSDWIFDPVFLIDKEYFNKILERATVDCSNKIVSYVLDMNDEYNDLYKYLSKKENLEIANIDNKKLKVEDWLKSIKDCKYLITDSFHGVCFALIFNKPFICIKNKNRGNARFETIIKYFNIQKNFVNSVNEIYNNNNFMSIDFLTINKKIEEKREADLQIIKKVLQENYSNNENAQLNKLTNIKFIKTQIKNKNFTSYENFKLKIKYYRCKFLANFTFGKLKKHYIEKKYCLKQKIRNNGVVGW